ncbi:MAG: hypothetical protein K0R31_2144 [Clostridiales bacterium]|jgi:hypothetical protein|nr:hypothetical protein [Clostridiales bacterium]
MKVLVFNPEGVEIDAIQKVVNIKDCADGRKLVTHEKECTCCTVVSRYVFQVPARYKIEVFVEELDEVSIVPYRR